MIDASKQGIYLPVKRLSLVAYYIVNLFVCFVRVFVVLCLFDVVMYVQCIYMFVSVSVSGVSLCLWHALSHTPMNTTTPPPTAQGPISPRLIVQGNLSVSQQRQT